MYKSPLSDDIPALKLPAAINFIGTLSLIIIGTLVVLPWLPIPNYPYVLDPKAYILPVDYDNIKVCEAPQATYLTFSPILLTSFGVNYLSKFPFPS
jgi:hypothetical protein